MPNLLLPQKPCIRPSRKSHIQVITNENAQVSVNYNSSWAITNTAAKREFMGYCLRENNYYPLNYSYGVLFTTNNHLKIKYDTQYTMTSWEEIRYYFTGTVISLKIHKYWFIMSILLPVISASGCDSFQYHCYQLKHIMFLFATYFKTYLQRFLLKFFSSISWQT